MTYVADTHAFLWWLAQDARLGQQATSAFEAGLNKLWVFHDRTIAATAPTLDAAVITRDEAIPAGGYVRTVWSHRRVRPSTYADLPAARDRA